MLTPSLAQEIATETSALIGFNVLITDGEGLVIGSGDVDRVGDFHEASVEVMRTMQLAAHGSSDVHDLHGVKPGITLPLIIAGEAVGTVGITGAPARVKRFGLLVQRQTEILLQESATLRSGLLRERALEDLVRDVASFDPDLVDREVLVARAAELGYDLNLARFAIALEITSAVEHRFTGSIFEPDTIGIRPEYLPTIRQVFSDPQDLVTTTGTGRGAIFYAASPPRSGTHALAACRRVVQMMKTQHRATAHTALGGPANSVGSLRASYQDASEALRLGIRVDPAKTVHSIDELRIHQVLGAVGHRGRAQLVAVVLDRLQQQRDWLALRETLTVWCENGFNLVNTAKALNVHRNTLVYRLDKLKRLTTLDAHNFRGFLTLYVACIADQIERMEGPEPG